MRTSGEAITCAILRCWMTYSFRNAQRGSRTVFRLQTHAHTHIELLERRRARRRLVAVNFCLCAAQLRYIPQLYQADDDVKPKAFFSLSLSLQTCMSGFFENRSLMPIWPFQDQNPSSLHSPFFFSLGHSDMGPKAYLTCLPSGVRRLGNLQYGRDFFFLLPLPFFFVQSFIFQRESRYGISLLAHIS